MKENLTPKYVIVNRQSHMAYFLSDLELVRLLNIITDCQVYQTPLYLVSLKLVRKWSKYEFWILTFLGGLNYSQTCVLSYGISYIQLKSCWLTQEGLEHDPFSTFFLIWQNSISKENGEKI